MLLSKYNYLDVVPIRFTTLLDFYLNAFSKVYIHFVLLLRFKMCICYCFTVINRENFIGLYGDPKMGNPSG